MRARARLKAGIARALGATRLDRALGRVGGGRGLPLVVGYHRVVEDAAALRGPAIPAMLVSRRMLEQQLDWIGRRYRFVSLDDVGARLESGDGFGDAVATVTFDDGYRDVYELAFPLLRRKGIPAAVFVVTDWIGSARLLSHDRLYRLLVRAWPAARAVLVRLGVAGAGPPPSRAPGDPFEALRLALTRLPQAGVARVIAALEEETTPGGVALDDPRPLSWEMLAEMRRAGVTVGAHTRSHAVLTRETAARVRDETAGARRALEARLGARVDHFAYPDGAFDAAVVDAVAAADYRFAYTACRHRDPRRPLLTIPRRLLWERSCLDAAGRFSPAVARCVTSGVFDLVAGCRRPHGASAGGRRPASVHRA